MGVYSDWIAQATAPASAGRVVAGVLWLRHPGVPTGAHGGIRF